MKLLKNKAKNFFVSLNFELNLIEKDYEKLEKYLEKLGLKLLTKENFHISLEYQLSKELSEDLKKYFEENKDVFLKNFSSFFPKPKDFIFCARRKSKVALIFDKKQESFLKNFFSNYLTFFKNERNLIHLTLGHKNSNLNERNLDRIKKIFQESIYFTFNELKIQEIIPLKLKNIFQIWFFKNQINPIIYINGVYFLHKNKNNFSIVEIK